MCHKIKILSKVKSGTLSLCKQCAIYHLEFNNIYFEFSIKELQHFKEYMLTIDLEYWEEKYSCNMIKRKIPIPSTQQNLVLMFNRQEMSELKSLLFFNQKKDTLPMLDIYDIDYTLILN